MPFLSPTPVVPSSKPLPTMPRVYSPECYRGLSCLAVGAGAGGSINMLARVTIVDYWGNEVLDTFVRPTEPVVNYRTTQTKITEEQLSDINPEALPFDVVQNKVAGLVGGCIIVGYTLWNDLSILGLKHLAINTRDVSLYLPFRGDLNQPNLPRLSTLVSKFMRRHIQCFSTDSAEDARACMDLFRCIEGDWEHYIMTGNWPCALPPAKFIQYYS